MVHAQNDIILQDVIVGKAEVSAPVSVTLKPGFHAKEGSNFHGFIGALQGQYSSASITSPSDSTAPASGSPGQNFIKTITYREAKSSIPAGSFKHSEDILYFDGLCRTLQTVNVGASPAGKDIIQPVLYDDFGREAIKTLPYTETRSGFFRTNVTEARVNTFYSSNPPEGIESDNKAYTLTCFDNSPLNRVISITGPGAAWSDKPVTYHYLSNESTEQGWIVTGNYFYSSFSYAINTLYVTETIDEEGNAIREYKDMLGQVVLKKSALGSDWLRTAYIYDDLGLLRCVMPPAATDPNTETDLCYYYKYDNRRRLAEKKIPGGGIVKLVYDKRDRLRFTRNSEQSAANEWSFIKYDPLNRPVMTGIFSSSSDAAVLEAAANAITLNETRVNDQITGYTNSSYPTSDIDIHTITYYDDYSFLDISAIDPHDSLQSVTYDKVPYIIQSERAGSVKGWITGTRTKVLSDVADASFVKKNILYSVIFYDKYGNVLRTISENHLRGRDIVSNLYEDITFRLIQTRQEYYTGSEQVIIEKWFEYDHTGRLLATSEKINGQPEITLNAMKYNDVGEMIKKYTHSDQTSGIRSFIQKSDYTYNIRGWLTKINDPSLSEDNDKFGMQLFYNSIEEMGSLAPEHGMFNGNIAGMKWALKNDLVRGYRFSYDGLSRLVEAKYADGSSLESNTDYFSELITGYDKNGNIRGLKRYYNNTLADNLVYEYFNSNKSNQLLKVTDTGTASGLVDDYPGTSQDYVYDANGNMTFDGSKNITLEYYRSLNLPEEIDFGNNNRIWYHYSADGKKLIKHTITASGTSILTHYAGNFVYEGSLLSYILTDEGRLIPFGTGTDRKFINEYNIRDHLGNNRVTFMGTNLGGAVDIVQTNNYYPFGLVMSQTNANTSPTYRKNKYLYNNKEIQSDNMTGEAINWYDYGARFYDPQIGRWNLVDPKAELGRRWSPYAYTFDNPIRFLDPDGMWPGDPFKTQRLAAIDFGKTFNGKSIESNKEYGSSIYPIKIDGETYYTYSVPNIGTAYEVDPSSPPIAQPLGPKATAIVHTHGAYSKYDDKNNFSKGDGEDIDYFKSKNIDGYVATPNGSLKEYDVKKDKKETISKEMPSDSKDPKRENNINSSGVDLRSQETKVSEKLDKYLEIFKGKNQ